MIHTATTTFAPGCGRLHLWTGFVRRPQHPLGLPARGAHSSRKMTRVFRMSLAAMLASAGTPDLQQHSRLHISGIPAQTSYCVMFESRFSALRKVSFDCFLYYIGVHFASTEALSVPGVATGSWVTAKDAVAQAAAFTTGTWTGLCVWTIASMFLYAGLSHFLSLPQCVVCSRGACRALSLTLCLVSSAAVTSAWAAQTSCSFSSFCQRVR
jgi:hypothetical protein